MMAGQTINLFAMPSPLMVGGEDERMIIANNFSKKTVGSGGPVVEMRRHSIAADTFQNVGDFIEFIFCGVFPEADALNYWLKLSSDFDGNDLTLLSDPFASNPGANFAWRIVLRIALAGTGVLKWEASLTGNVVSSHNTTSSRTESNQSSGFIDINNGFDLVLTMQSSANGLAYVDASWGTLTRNPSGSSNYAGKPSNLAYDGGTDTISFDFGPDFPDPVQWSLLDNNGGETGYWIAGNLRSFAGVTPYKNGGNNFYIVGVSSAASGYKEMTQRSDAINVP